MDVLKTTTQEGMSHVYIKNIDHAKAVVLADLVTVVPGQIVSRTLAQNAAVSMTLFAFSKGEEISTHESTGDAMVTALYGTGKLTIDGVEHIINTGETVVMPANTPHAVAAVEDFKMELVVVFPQK